MKFVLFGIFLSLAACGSDDNTNTTPTTTTDVGQSDSGSTDDAGANNDASSDLTLSEFVCNYTNPFSRGNECRTYLGSWTQEDVEADCTTQMGEATSGTCPADSLLGTCEIATDGLGLAVLHAYGEASACNAQSVGCRVFAKGEWKPTDACDGGVVVEPQPESVFVPPVLVCKDPLPGEPAGLSEGGQVCTWQLISGATEPGREVCRLRRLQRRAHAATLLSLPTTR
ncbi:MAG: hypothetical protein R3E66_04725 [bacterium]